MNRSLMIVLIIGALLMPLMGNVYACDTGTCEQEANQVARSKYGNGASAALYDQGCNGNGQCGSSWAIIFGDQIQEWYDCISWAAECEVRDNICPYCLWGCYQCPDGQTRCWEWDIGVPDPCGTGGSSGGSHGGGGGGGGWGDECYIRKGDFCPVSCYSCSYAI